MNDRKLFALIRNKSHFLVIISTKNNLKVFNFANI